MKLKIFSDRSYLYPGMPPSPILYPFWRDLYSNQLDSWISAYDRYLEVGESLFEITSLEAADVVILPMDWRSIRGDSWRNPIHREAEELAIRFAKLVEGAKKPLVVFFGSECSDEALPFDATVFRQSVYRSASSSTCDFVFPFFCEDFVHYFLKDELPIRPKREKPVVGFCGLANPLTLKKRLQTPIYQAFMLVSQGRTSVSPYKGEALRYEALNLLSRHPNITANFVIRDRAIFFEAPDPVQKQKARLEYVQNMVDSDYIFCCRGSGNYSHRLYEVLSCGRIPVFVDTDCRLPWDSQIDWQKYCVWVDENDLQSIPEKILEFHSRLSDRDFIELQYACRQLWQKRLSAEGFYDNVQQFLAHQFAFANSSKR